MGREFVELFDRWAESYDSTVSGMDEEYKEVFENYGAILQNVANRVHGRIIEFGVGTGNLTKFILAKTDEYTGVEPSEKMRNAASEKLPNTKIISGDFINFPVPVTDQPVDAFVSSYAFHHLTDGEKQIAANKYGSLLKTGGKVVFADTIFMNGDHHGQMIRDAEKRHFFNLAEDLKTEYYTTIPTLTTIFENAGFDVSFQSMNKFVWILEATKQ
ncbi:class I SAM-dependent DNA methyltransferase [Evansella tamaricis]|uniref:Uncharacterized methyltransferase KS419_00575 n=1 Tax=Evansella tamaricis TaxID=2069301 RepID=A0ABS6J987_9BACI|nr:class I SAM-dependent methyltransferase [Evansella tamaricis]MBU9710256.1 class I SAM-dependent methyltransferase [Evansella tamaricis]